MSFAAEPEPSVPVTRRPKRRAAEAASNAVKVACASPDSSSGQNEAADDASLAKEGEMSSIGSNASDSSDLMTSKRRRSRVARVRHKLRERKRSNTIRDSINDLRKLMALEDASVTALGRARPFRGVEGEEISAGGIALDLDPAPLTGHWFIQNGVPLSQLVTRAPCRTRADVLERAVTFAKDPTGETRVGLDIIHAVIQLSIATESCVGGMSESPYKFAVLATASGLPVVATSALLLHLQQQLPRRPDGSLQPLPTTKGGTPTIPHHTFDGFLPWFRRAVQRLATRQIVPISVKVIPHGVCAARLWTGPAMVAPLPDLSDNINAFLVSFPEMKSLAESGKGAR